MLIIGTLFFIFGFVTWLNGSLIPFLKVICDLNDFQALFVTFAFYIAYTTMAYPMSFILTKSGYKNGMAIGLGIMAVGALLFIPAAFSADFLIFLAALFTLGSGLGALHPRQRAYDSADGIKSLYRDDRSDRECSDANQHYGGGQQGGRHHRPAGLHRTYLQ